MRKNYRRLCACLAVLHLLLALPLLASVPETASIRGKVKDSLGAVVPNAMVDLLQSGRSIASTKTDSEGSYVLKTAAGRYQVRAAAPSFRAALSEPVYLSPTAEARMDLTLNPGILAQQITVTATGTPTPEAQIGYSVSVLASDQYRYVQDVQQPLRLIPGLQMTQSGQLGAASSLFIRGGDSYANKVLVDGLPANFVGGSVNFANLPATGVEQIEVLRGPNSALYGSDALAGVVSLTTAHGTTSLPLVTYSADGGNFGTYRQEGSVGGAYKQFDYFSDFSAIHTGNDIPDDAFHNSTYAGNFGWTPKAGTSLRVTVRNIYNNGEIPNAIALYGIPDDAGQKDQDTYVGATLQNQTSERWHNLVRYGAVRLRETYTDYAPTGIPYDAFGLGFPTWYIGAPVTLTGANGYAVSGQAIFQYPGTYPSSTLSTTNRDFLYAQSDYRFSQHLLALVGFKYEDERGESATTGYSVSSIQRGNYSYTMQIGGDFFNRLYYTIGSGVEKNALFGVEPTPRASLAYYLVRPGNSRFLSGTKLRFSFGEGIKEPTIYQQSGSLYSLLSGLSNGSQLISQYKVSPVGAQRSRTYDGGLDQELLNGRGRVRLTYFHNEFTNGVEDVPESGLISLGVPLAVAQAAGYGAYVNTSVGCRPRCGDRDRVQPG